MISVGYAKPFNRRFLALEPLLQEEAIEKIELFKNPRHHKRLKVHKLHGEQSHLYAFSVNYHIRIVFAYTGKQSAVCLTIGTHDEVY